MSIPGAIVSKRPLWVTGAQFHGAPLGGCRTYLSVVFQAEYLSSCQLL